MGEANCYEKTMGEGRDVRRLERALGVLLPRVNFPAAKAVVALAVHAQGVTKTH